MRNSWWIALTIIVRLKKLLNNNLIDATGKAIDDDAKCNVDLLSNFILYQAYLVYYTLFI